MFNLYNAYQAPLTIETILRGIGTYLYDEDESVGYYAIPLKEGKEVLLLDVVEGKLISCRRVDIESFFTGKDHETISLDKVMETLLENLEWCEMTGENSWPGRVMLSRYAASVYNQHTKEAERQHLTLWAETNTQTGKKRVTFYGSDFL